METRPIISCFDLAGKVGVATGPVGTAKPCLETWDLSAAGDQRPARLLLLDTMLEQHFAKYQIERVFYEKPLPLAVLMDIGATEYTIQMLRSLVAVVEQACARHEVMVDSWEVKRARHGVLGRGTWPRGKAKAGVMAGVRMMGFKPGNDNEADALVGWLYWSALLNPRLAHLQTPLFAAVR